jgi:hypothetical protein
MAKLWLTERAYNFWGSLIRIAYWLAAIFISSIYVDYCSEDSYFKIGLMLLSVLFFVIFILLARMLDHFFKRTKN